MIDIFHSLFGATDYPSLDVVLCFLLFMILVMCFFRIINNIFKN